MMRKLLALLVSSLLLVSCLSVTSDGFVQETTIDGASLAEVTVVPQGGTNDTSCYIVYVKNLTDGPISVDWGGCSISYLGKTYFMVVERQYGKTFETGVSTEIPAGTLDAFTVYSSGQLRIGANTYEIVKIPTAESSVTISIEKGDVSTKYNFNITRQQYQQSLVQKGIYY